jgi:hypothetical protein
MHLPIALQYAGCYALSNVGLRLQLIGTPMLGTGVVVGSSLVGHAQASPCGATAITTSESSFLLQPVNGAIKTVAEPTKLGIH